MNHRISIVVLAGAVAGLSILNLAYGGPSGYGKAGLDPFGKSGIHIYQEAPKNRVGVQATGGLGIKAEFLADAYTKYKPKVPTRKLRDSEEEFLPGVEVFYERVLSSEQSRHLWGLRAGLGYMNFEAESSMPAGLQGSRDHELDADILYSMIGPFYEHRFTDRFYAQMSAGLAVAYVDAQLSTDSSGSGITDSESDSDFLFGAYVSAAIGYDIAPHCSLLGGIRYQYMDQFEISNGLTRATLDSDGAYQLFVGLRWAF